MRATETDISRAALVIAAQQPNGIATFHRMKREIPNIIRLSAADLKISNTRPNEAMWEQLIRNIKSHSETPGNFICEGYLEHVQRSGYKITATGRQYAQNHPL